MTHAAHPEHGQEVVVLGELAEHLLSTLPQHPAGRAARTVLTGPVMRAVLIALAAGAEMAEHETPAAATLQVLTGRVRMVGEHDTTLEAGELMAVPPERHAVHAETDAVVLLTVALA